MGLFDKLKSAVNAVTGGAATVTLDYSPSFVYPGDQVSVRITAPGITVELRSPATVTSYRVSATEMANETRFPTWWLVLATITYTTESLSRDSNVRGPSGRGSVSVPAHPGSSLR